MLIAVPTDAKTLEDEIGLTSRGDERSSGAIMTVRDCNEPNLATNSALYGYLQDRIEAALSVRSAAKRLSVNCVPGDRNMGYG